MTDPASLRATQTLRPEDAPPLPAGQVHLWFAELDAAPADRALLSPRELERAERFSAPEAQARYRRSRALLRRLLARYSGADPRELRFEPRGEGKPVLTHPVGGPLFNLSHTGGHWVAAFARDRAVGVDLELVDPPKATERVARRAFAPGEQQRLAAATGEERIELFFRTWTVREAVTKLRGQGVFTQPDRFEVIVAPDGRWRIEAEPSRRPFWVGGVDAAPDVVGALALEGDEAPVSAFRVPSA